MKKGLILEGGAMRGMFTAGVMDVMMENHIQFDGAVGVSAGAAFGCNYKSHQIGRVIRYNKIFAKDDRYSGIKSLITTGNLYNAEFCYHEVPLKLDVFDTETYRKDPMEFWCVATDTKTGKALYHECKEMDDVDLEWIRASASMPIVSKPVEIGGRKLLDGGIADPIPVTFFRSLGYEKNIVVLTQPKTYVKQPQKGLKLMKLPLKDYPNIYEDLRVRHTLYNQEVTTVHELAKTGEVFVIQPEQDLQIGKTEHDPKVLEAVYQEGRKTCESLLEQIISYLKD